MATNHHLIQRKRSIHYSTKHIKGITHAEILEQIERTIETDRIKAIQITERDCIVTKNDIVGRRCRSSKATLKMYGWGKRNHKH